MIASDKIIAIFYQELLVLVLSFVLVLVGYKMMVLQLPASSSASNCPCRCRYDSSDQSHQLVPNIIFVLETVESLH